MEQGFERLSACAVVACLCKDRDDVRPKAIKRAFCTKLGVLEKDIKCRATGRRTSSSSLSTSTIVTRRRRWGDFQWATSTSVSCHGASSPPATDLRYHVRICL
jgi:hypothetical protein